MPSGVPPMPSSMSMPVSGRAAMMAPATSPSVMNLIIAPVARISSASCSWRGRSSRTTLTSSGRLPLALATAATFSATEARMSTTSAASGPVTSFSM